MQNENQVNSHELVVPVTIELHPSLSRVLDAQDSLHTSFSLALMQELTEVMDTLGIPGKPDIQIGPFPEEQLLDDRFLKVSVDGRVCRYSDEMLQRIYSYVNEEQLNPDAKPSFILAWLCELSKEESEHFEIKSERLIEFLCLTCIEIIKRQPSALLELPQVVVYSAALPNPTSSLELQPGTWPPEPEWMHPILSKLLQFNISLSDAQTVARVLSRAKGRSQEDVVEDLVDVLCSDVIEIHISREYLKQLSSSGNGFGELPAWRDYLFREFGLRYPEFRFVQLETSKSFSFACTINHLTMLPWIGLQPDQCLVFSPASYLQSLQIQARAVIDPLGRSDSSVVDGSVPDTAKDAGLLIHNPIDYLIDCLLTHLKENRQCFVYRKEIQEQLIQLGSTYPALQKAVQASISFEQITRVLRELVSEEISVTNLRFILERMLDYDYIYTDAANYMAFEDQLPVQKQPDNASLDTPVNIASFVRIGLKRYISSKYANEHGELSAFDLMSLVSRIVESQASSIEDSRLLEFLRSEVNALSPGTSPVLLTTLDLRPTIHTIVSSELPRLPVLAFQELTSDLKVNYLT